MNKYKGASIAQYVIIIAILLLGIIPCFVMIGQTINNEFNKFSTCLNYKDEIYNFKPFKATSPITNTQTKDGYSINNHQDGSVSIVFGNQSASIPASVYNEAIETMGTAGTETLIDEVALIMKGNGEEYSGDLPLEVTFGQGEREENWKKRGGFLGMFSKNKTAVYEGSASANTSTIRMGNKLTIIQTDNSCKGNGCKSTNIGTYKIRGSIDDKDNYKAIVYGPADKERGTYTASVNYDGGLNLENTKYKPKLEGVESVFSGIPQFNWDIDFFDNRSLYDSYFGNNNNNNSSGSASST